MRLRWVFTVQTVVILLKVSLNSCLIGLDQLYRGRTGRSSRGKGFNNIFSATPVACSPWPSGHDMARHAEGPDFNLGQNFFFFASFLFFSFCFYSFLFSYCSFVLFLYIDCGQYIYPWPAHFSVSTVNFFTFKRCNKLNLKWNVLVMDICTGLCSSSVLGGPWHQTFALG